MAQTLPQQSEQPSAPPVPSEGALASARAYIATMVAATRTAVAVEGHLQPSEQDLKTLGIDHTPAYSAVVRH